MNIKDLMTETNRRCLEHRALNRLISGSSFANVWNKASDVSRSDVIEFIRKGTIEPVKKWIRHWEERDLETLSFRRLRDKASRNNLPNYSRMTREELIKSLKEND